MQWYLAAYSGFRFWGHTLRGSVCATLPTFQRCVWIDGFWFFKNFQIQKNYLAPGKSVTKQDVINTRKMQFYAFYFSVFSLVFCSAQWLVFFAPFSFVWVFPHRQRLPLVRAAAAAADCATLGRFGISSIERKKIKRKPKEQIRQSFSKPLTDWLPSSKIKTTQQCSLVSALFFFSLFFVTKIYWAESENCWQVGELR